MKIFYKNSIVFLICSIFLFFSCSEKKEIHSDKEDITPSGKLYSEVMDVHDNVMPKMDEIMILKGKTNKRIKELDSLTKVNPKLNVKIEKLKLDSLLTGLQAADDGMMNWMHHFDPNMKEMKEEKKVRYLEDEKIKITEVKQKTDSILEKAKSIFPETLD